MTHPTDDQLREAAQAVLDRWDSLDWKAAPTADYMHRLRAALAAAPQPATPGERMIRAAEEAASIARGEAEPASVYPTETDWGEPVGREVLPPYQPAPAPADERASMIELIARARGHFTPNEMAWAGNGYHEEEGKIADALLAAGWTRGGAEAGLREALADLVSWFDSGPSDYGPWIIRAGERGADDAVEAARAALARPSAPETLAWAVVADGEVVWVDVGNKGDAAEIVAEAEGGKPVRVAIRIVTDQPQP